MHRLILMRHAQAEPNSPSGGDEARPLSAVGRNEALLMGRALAERGLKPDLALVSSAVRTRQTWEQMHDAFGDVEVRDEPRLYNAPADVLRGFVEASEEEAGCLLVLAHNPGVHALAGDYLSESAASPAILDRLAGGFPTGAAALFTVDAAGRCTYEGFLTPRTLGGAA
ncbi:MAG: SixA phosphatase family protein [Brevundimonas aurantiaca]|jgi:phosphohistidine phosphatase|uniref:Phosphohistidine phosphatase n=1 Tax=Brevundimonas aurantiaca TaxID=74316 RepID=A0A7W9C4P6_9CAUL|nr:MULTISPECIES: histidine phosphatase family protein [Brevundimonas]MBB1179438.1 histidine phosphatase family protein [Pseudomonas sp. FW305-3-2-15-E-TSA4]MEC7797824.1 histidine phosphatase family protein [Pseudomonadota bacterium]ALJ09722.1 histidine phosphatase [Brevundimonas sp. DS20]MAL56707.1 histidine phosphatase [Brevundimonas sp.]MBA4786850.1 histidine phosphatase family protein [Brevundimonas sp.]